MTEFSRLKVASLAGIVSY